MTDQASPLTPAQVQVVAQMLDDRQARLDALCSADRGRRAAP